MEGDHCTGHPKRWGRRSPGEGRGGPLTILSSLSLSSHCFLPSPFPSLPLGAPSSRQGMLSCPVPACPLPQAWRGPPGLSQERPEATAALGCAVAPPAPSQEGAEATAALGCAVAAPAAVRSGGAAILAALPAARGAALLARGAGRPFCHSWQLGLGGSRQREPSGLGVPGRFPVP